MHRQNTRTTPAVQGALLAELYPVPKFWDTEEQRVKYFHLDLVDFSPAELRLEADRLKLRLISEDQRSDDFAWLLERWDAIQEALEKRKGRADVRN